MKVEIKIPSFGESIVEVTVSSILKETGSSVKADEEILELETDKLNQALFSPAAGKLTLSVKVGDVVKVGQVVGSIDSEGAEASAPPQEKEKAPPPPAPSSKETPSQFPKARKEVDEAIREEKKETSKPAPTPSSSSSSPPKKPKEGETRKKMSNLRKVIAERLVQAKNQTAMLTTFNEVDMSAVIAVRQKEQESFQKKHGVKLGFMSFFIRAAAVALKEFPAVNACIEGDEIVYSSTCDIGVAVSTEKGLMVPVIRKAEELSNAEIEKLLKDFAEKARKGTIAIDDLQGGSFTITNGGVFGSLLSTPILNPPQSGILGMHNIVKRAVVVEDQIVIRPMMYLALSYDHRIIDGKESISFLIHMKNNLEAPTRLLLEL